MSDFPNSELNALADRVFVAHRDGSYELNASNVGLDDDSLKYVLRRILVTKLNAAPQWPKTFREAQELRRRSFFFQPAAGESRSGSGSGSSSSSSSANDYRYGETLSNNPHVLKGFRGHDSDMSVEEYIMGQFKEEDLDQSSYAYAGLANGK